MRIKNILLFLIVLLFSLDILGQTDYTLINIYRAKSMVGGAVKNHIIVNGQEVCALESGGHLEFKLFSHGIVKIQSASNFNVRKLSNYEKNQASRYIEINAKGGEVYFLQLTIQSGEFDFKEIGEPLSSGKLKDKNFISLTENDIGNQKIAIEHPKTDWTVDKLESHWKKNGFAQIEGIYEKAGNNIKYKLAVVKEENEYKVVYLSGANGSFWEVGDVKSELQKTAQFGVFKGKWYLLNKNTSLDAIVTFNNLIMTILYENDGSKDIYLKTYPTYDEKGSADQSLNVSKWKGNGSGFIIDNRGYIVTNYHVVENTSEIEIDIVQNSLKKSYNAKIISSDKQNDLSIIKIDDINFKEFSNPPYNFRTIISDVGSSVFTLGYPMALTLMGEEIKFTDGKISSKTGFQGDITTYQITVPIQPGNSGGPLFDYDGNLIAVINAKIKGADNVSYAIKSSYLRSLIDVLPENLNLPNDQSISSKSLIEKIKVLSEYTVLIKVK
jgi:S1-C subfamily serine protease